MKLDYLMSGVKKDGTGLLRGKSMEALKNIFERLFFLRISYDNKTTKSLFVVECQVNNKKTFLELILFSEFELTLKSGY